MTLKKSVITIFIIVLSLVYFGCSTTKEEKTISQKKVEKISPNHARINGEITKIFSVNENENPKDPCTKVPCVAMVKIKGVEYGAGFPTLDIYSEIKVKFAFTLNPTSKELFPNMKEKYPGLKVGEKFTAILSFSYEINHTEPNYEVYGYSIK